MTLGALALWWWHRARTHAKALRRDDHVRIEGLAPEPTDQL
jgi:hypothetical protein